MTGKLATNPFPLSFQMVAQPLKAQTMEGDDEGPQGNFTTHRPPTHRLWCKSNCSFVVARPTKPRGRPSRHGGSVIGSAGFFLLSSLLSVEPRTSRPVVDFLFYGGKNTVCGGLTAPSYQACLVCPTERSSPWVSVHGTNMSTSISHS